MATAMRFVHDVNLLRYIVRRGHVRQYAVESIQSIATEVVLDADYPPVKPKMPPGKWGDTTRNLAWQLHEYKEEIASLTNVQGKINKLTEKEHNVWDFPAIHTIPRTLPYQQYVTKTHLQQGLPECYNTMNVDEQLNTIKPLIEDAILQEKEILPRSLLRSGTLTHHWNRSLSLYLTESIINVIMSSLAGHNNELIYSMLDKSVHVSAYWQRFGFKIRRNAELSKTVIMPHFSAMFHSENMADFQVRIHRPLPEFVPHDDPECQGSYPEFKYSPRAIGQNHKFVKRTCVPGFKLGDPCEFGLVSFHHDQDLERVREYGEHHRTELLRGYGMTSSFIWLLGQAHYQGFNAYQDLTYPLTTQTVVSNGQTYSFYAYQLNTLDLWRDDTGNPVRNLCWYTDEAKMYDTVEDGQVKGFNDDVLRQLIKFFMRTSSDRGGIDLRPNLDQSQNQVEQMQYIHDKSKNLKNIEEKKS